MKNPKRAKKKENRVVSLILEKENSYQLNYLRKCREVISVWAKQVKDKRKLPLTSAHFSLYKTIHSYYKNEMGYWPELVDCRDFNDKIQWLKLFDQDERIIQCTDKIGVRDFVAQRVGTQYLVPLLQRGSTLDDLDFSSLPKSFVLKTNNDSGSVFIVRDKSLFNLESVRTQIANALKRKYAWEKGEWSYSCVDPVVFVEKFVDPENPDPPPDYKFHCVEGRVRQLQYIYDRGDKTKEQMINREGVSQGYVLFPRFLAGDAFCKPEQWDEMVRVAETLACGFKYVRVDLYLSQTGQIYVGELTFWPMSGCYHGEGQKILGEALDFDRTTFKPLVYKRFQRAYN
ncbi:MAG: ATP-grasp fold amidoligase family protein [Candidatus Omnitrophota bacterium]